MFFMNTTLLIFFSLFNIYYNLNAQTNFALTLSQHSSEEWKKGKVQTMEILHKFDTKGKKELYIFKFDYSFKYAVGFIYKKEGEKNDYVLPTQMKYFSKAL